MTTPEIGDDVWLWESATPEAAKIVAEAYPAGYHVVAWAFDGNTIFRAALPLIDATSAVPYEAFITMKGVRPNWNTATAVEAATPPTIEPAQPTNETPEAAPEATPTTEAHQ